MEFRRHLKVKIFSFISDEKRNRPYSFGLGKRDPLNEERRANRYGFGLGRR